MNIISVILYVVWAFIFVAASNRLYEVIKYHHKVSFRDWVLIIGSLVMPIWFFVDRFLLNRL